LPSNSGEKVFASKLSLSNNKKLATGKAFSVRVCTNGAAGSQTAPQTGGIIFGEKFTLTQDDLKFIDGNLIHMVNIK
jgi:hypothetical protein